MVKDGHVTHNSGFKYTKDYIYLIDVNNNRLNGHVDACRYNEINSSYFYSDGPVDAF